MNISDRCHLVLVYYKEAQRCWGRAYLAACVMQGASLEGALAMPCFLYPNEVRRAVFRRKKFRHTRNKALDFKYYELINIAVNLVGSRLDVFSSGARGQVLWLGT